MTWKFLNPDLEMDHSEAVQITKNDNAVTQVLLRNPRGASARVSFHGGQVLSGKTERGEELFFTSSKAIFRPPAAVRGGIPVYFPQFGNRGSLEQHGFARNRVWIIDENLPSLIKSPDSYLMSFVDLLLKSSNDNLKIWPHSFELRLRVILTVDGHLSLISRVRNINYKPFRFSFTYHTYFCLRYQADRVYLSCSDTVAAFYHDKKATFMITKGGLPDIGVWNPWEKKSRTIPDFRDNEYKQTGVNHAFNQMTKVFLTLRTRLIV